MSQGSDQDPALTAARRQGLRLVYGARAEGLLTGPAHVALSERRGGRVAERRATTAADMLDLIYTTDPSAIGSATLQSGGTRHDLGDPLTLTETLLRPALASQAGRDVLDRCWEAFLLELSDSLRNETLTMAARETVHATLRDRFRGARTLIDALTGEEADRGGLLLQLASFSGHRTHPATKTRLRRDGDGERRSVLSPDELKAYSPEFAPDVAVPLLAVRASAVTVGLSRRLEGHGPDGLRRYVARGFPELYRHWAEALRRDVGERAADDFVPLPVHPLQTPEITRRFADPLARGDILRLPGICARLRPSVSFRTLVPAASLSEPSIKTTLNMQMTSVLRTLAPARAYNAPVYSDLLLDILDRDAVLASVLRVVPEPAAVYWGTDPNPDGSDYRDGYHLAAVFKDNVGTRLNPGEIAVPLNALFAVSPVTGERILIDMMRHAGVDAPRAALAWVETYARTVLTADLGMLAGYGVGLESHQQNVDTVFGADGWPRALVYRDINGGVELFAPALRARDLDPADRIHPVRKGLYEDLTVPLRQTSHTTLASHLLPIVQVVAHGVGIEPSALHRAIAREAGRVLREAISTYPSDILDRLGTEVSGALLDSPLEVKCLLTMRARQTQDSLHAPMDNPLTQGPAR